MLEMRASAGNGYFAEGASEKSKPSGKHRRLRRATFKIS